MTASQLLDVEKEVIICILVELNLLNGAEYSVSDEAEREGVPLVAPRDFDPVSVVF